MKSKKGPLWSKPIKYHQQAPLKPYKNRADAYVGPERGNLARTITPKPKKRNTPKYKIPPTPRTSGFGWGGP